MHWIQTKTNSQFVSKEYLLTSLDKTERQIKTPKLETQLDRIYKRYQKT